MSYRPCYIGAFVGNKGSGKSLSLCQMIVHELVENNRVWSNMPVKLSPAIMKRRYSRHGTEFKYREAEPINWDLLLMLDETIVEGTVAIDELTYNASNRDFMSTRNKLLTALTRQVRHRSLNLIYTAKSIDWIDNHLRQETDFVVKCKDLAFSPWGQQYEVPGGTAIIRDWYDLSGMMTGTSMYDNGGVPYKRERFYGTVYWDCYDTKEIISLEEAFARYKLDLTQKIISNKEDNSNVIVNAVMRVISHFIGLNYREIPTKEFRDYLSTEEGIDIDPGQLGKYIPKDIKRKARKSGSEYVYDLSSLIE